MQIRKVRQTLAIITVLTFGLGSKISAQSDLPTDLPVDDATSITTIEGPQEKDVRAIAVGDGTAWILSEHQLLKVDPSNNQLTPVAIENVKGNLHSGFAVGGQGVWILGEAHDIHGIHRIDPSTGKCIANILLKKHKGEDSVVYGEGALWVLNKYDGTLTKIDPTSNQITGTVELGKMFWQNVKAADGSVWAMGEEKSIIKRIDPSSSKIVDEFSIGPNQHNGIFSLNMGMFVFSAGEGFLWVADDKFQQGKYSLSRVDPKTHESSAKLQMDGSHGAPVFWNGSAWVSTAGYHLYGHFITKLDPTTNRTVAKILLPVERGSTTFSNRGTTPPVLLADEDSLWAFSEGSTAYSRLLVRRIQRK